MSVPFRLKFMGIELETELSPETACKIALALAGTAAGTAVIAAGVACGNANIVKLGGGIAVASILGAGAAIGLNQTASPQLSASSGDAGVPMS